MTDVIVYLALAAVAVLLIVAIATGKFSNKGIGPASLTSFHDFQTKDKQEAIEYVMEEKAGKKMEEQESGEKNKHGD
jgi:hypothetical protein